MPANSTPVCRLLRLGITAAFLSLGLIASSTSLAQVSADERAALVDLFQATGGQSWFDNSNWLDDEGTECEWYGVNCLDGTVLSLSLRDNGLNGELPDSLTELVSLRFLFLRGNNLAGGVPAWLGDIPSLEALDLGLNPLGGSVPGSVLSAPALTYLWLDHTGVDGISDDILGEQGSLRGLWLNGNQIPAVPGVLGSLTQLQRLSLRGNLISDPLPESVLTSFPFLFSLDVSFNPMGELPHPALGALPFLSYLDARGIQAGDDLSDWFQQATDLADNNPFPNLIQLNLQDNALTGPLPPDLFGLGNLQEARLDSNQLSGPLPYAIFDHPRLRSVTLANNQLESELPDPARTKWPEVEYDQLLIDLRGNEALSGPFPQSLVYRTLLNRMQPLFSGTALEFGDCFGLRQVSTLHPEPSYDPAEFVEVAIWMRNRAWPGSPRVVDIIPEHWQAIPYPDCYCVAESPATVMSAPVALSVNTVFRYYLQGPTDPMLAEAGQFDGVLDPQSPDIGTRLICGDSQGWIETLYFDTFESQL